MRDIKYIIKRIIIGVGIALAMMFIRQNVYAYEWETSSDVPIDTSSYQFVSNIQVSIGRYPATGSLQCPSNGNYPIITQASNINANFAIGTDSGDYVSTTGIQNARTQLSTMYHDRWYVSFGTYEFQPNTLYKVIIPLAYNSNVFTSMLDNVNESKILDDTIYSFSDESFDVYSASYSFNTTNDIEENNSTFPTYMYFSVLFSTTAINENALTLYINGDTDIIHSLTAFNTISDSNYLFRPNWNRTTCATSFYGQYSNRFYKPFLYTTSTEADNWYIDGNDFITSGTSDIKDAIDEIVDGTFSSDELFPYLNNGGVVYGDNEYTLQDLLLVPLNFLKAFVKNDDECIGPTIPLPIGANNSFVLPCATQFFGTIFSSTFILSIKSIFGVVFGCIIIINLYNDINVILSPLIVMIQKV